MGNCNSDISITNMEVDIKFLEPNKALMILVYCDTTDGKYKHTIKYVDGVLKIMVYKDKLISVIENKCETLEILFKDLQKLADKSGAHNSTLKNSHAFETIKNNIIYTQKMFGELPQEFLGKYLLFSN